MLELLAEEAAPSRFEALLQRARHEASPQERERLERAVKLAQDVQVAFSRRQQREAGLAALVGTAHDLSGSGDLNSLLAITVSRVRRLLNVDVAFLSLLENDGALHVHTFDGATTALDAAPLEQGGGLGRIALSSNAPVWTPDYLNDDGIPRSSQVDEVARSEGIRALVAVPLRQGDLDIGVLYCAERHIRHFSPDEIGLVCSLADLATAAIERAELLDHARDQVSQLELDDSRTHTSLIRLQQIGFAYSRILGLLLADADLATLAQAAGDALDGAVQVRDPAGRVLAASEPMPDLDEALISEAVLGAHAQRTPMRTRDGAWVVPVMAGAENLGVLVLNPVTGLVGEDEQLLTLTAQACALHAIMRRSEAVAEGLVRDELLDELLTTPLYAPRQVVRRAKRLGLDLDRSHTVLVARPDDGEQGRAVVWATSYAYRLSGLKTVRNGCIVLLLPKADASQAARAVSEELASVLRRPVSVGSAGPGAGVTEVARMYQEAVRCMEALTAISGVGGAASAKDLGFLGLLLSDDHDVDGFVRTTLGPVLDYDRERSSDLLRTLEAYFASGGSPTNAAEALHVHTNTVARRLERVSELLGATWQTPVQSLEVQLALRLHRVRRVLFVAPEAGTTAG
ncbi:helix-turn-helix domain-containing protein [Streptomyces sp. NPDC095613]|uniref:helix-turn-helix domain-containing protein n=1 Tax=Streptomyces sp. NPDC095613 TaxID=3155540 RepID=UPI00331BBF37